MLKFVELQLGQGWVAEPNAPEPEVSVAGSKVNVCFRSYRRVQHKKPSGILRAFNRFSKAGPKFDEAWGTLSFIGCSRWRWDDTNDHEWHKVDGHGRYSGIAPRWGEFYELVGHDPIRDAVPWETIQEDTANSRHFLYYFRDETLEFMAEEWSFIPSLTV
ncbi:hypothetical protein NXC14_CH03853 [Rhizobium sp. NXC14]|uniref:hypothetical protein n=1 Tax=Rhizobium sp. NXC14 TaxID=1981173 RepID=UPI000A20A83B|nr:hypothetical protein [Rhizobium sp. NXC14]ARO31737.1 hypothetical protein NXC14_CH03853 [Rhizobium sp. NXC14]